jgi:hypothetical protein
MRLVLHPKVYSDIDAIMRYYERIAGSQLANDFTQNCGILWTSLQRDQLRFQFGSAIYVE